MTEQRLADGSPAYVARCEEDVIGGCLVFMMPTDIEHIRQSTGIQKEWFRNYRLGIIWNALLKAAEQQPTEHIETEHKCRDCQIQLMQKEDVPMLTTLVCDVLYNEGTYEEVGGIEYIDKLVINVCQNYIHTSREGIKTNIEIMKDWVARRKDFQEGQKLVQRAFRPQGPQRRMAGVGALPIEVTAHEV